MDRADTEITAVLPVRAAADAAAHDGLAEVSGIPPEVAWLRGRRGVRGVFLLVGALNTIGRSRDCDVVLAAPTVSRLHCEIGWHGNGWFIRSTGRNGTAVNQVGLRPGTTMPLVDGDTVAIGTQVELRLVMPPRDESVRLTLDVAGASATGDRRHNEDAYHASGSLAAVADGVGGRPAGDVASRLCVEVLAAASPDEEMAALVQRMNRELLRRGTADPRLNGMASTLDAARLVSRGGVQWLEGVHLGDGSAVVQDGEQVVWVTQPHTYAAALVAAGHLREADVAAHPEQGALMRAIGIGEAVRADFWQRQARPGRRLVVFTDGLLGALGTARITQVLAELRDLPPERVATQLVEAALAAAGSSDNTTVVVADVVPSGK